MIFVKVVSTGRCVCVGVRGSETLLASLRGQNYIHDNTKFLYPCWTVFTFAPGARAMASKTSALA